MPHRGVELHPILAKRAVAVQTDDLCRGLGGLGADRKGQPDPHCAQGSGVEPVAGDWRPKFRISCPSTDRIAARCMKFLISSHSRSG